MALTSVEKDSRFKGQTPDIAGRASPGRCRVSTSNPQHNFAFCRFVCAQLPDLVASGPEMRRSLQRAPKRNPARGRSCSLPGDALIEFNRRCRRGGVVRSRIVVRRGGRDGFPQRCPQWSVVTAPLRAFVRRRVASLARCSIRSPEKNVVPSEIYHCLLESKATDGSGSAGRQRGA